jgi:cyclopropane fatty-acyl-phospholipid synthase-like methyltransferase
MISIFIANQFKKPTGFFGKIISKLMKKGNSYVYDKLIPALEINPKDHILEIGYGPGIGVDRILQHYDCFVSGIDFSELMFKEASVRNRNHIENKKAELTYGDFLSSNLNPHQYDKIFCINVIYFWDTLDEPFRKVKSELKEGGIFCLYMAHRDDLNRLKFTSDDVFNKYTIDQVIQCLQSSGFKDISYEVDRGYIIKCRK